RNVGVAGVDLDQARAFAPARVDLVAPDFDHRLAFGEGGGDLIVPEISDARVVGLCASHAGRHGYQGGRRSEGEESHGDLPYLVAPVLVPSAAAPAMAIAASRAALEAPLTPTAPTTSPSTTIGSPPLSGADQTLSRGVRPPTIASSRILLGFWKR